MHGGIYEADRNKAVVSFQKGASSVLVSALVYSVVSFYQFQFYMLILDLAHVHLVS